MPCISTRPSLCSIKVLNKQNIYEPTDKKNVLYIPQTNVGESNTPFNLRLSDHRNVINNPKAIPACNHFKIHGHNFMKHAKFTITEQLTEILNVSKDTLRLRVKRWEDFWVIKLETLAPKGLKQKLNNVRSPITAISVHLILIYCS